MRGSGRFLCVLALLALGGCDAAGAEIPASKAGGEPSQVDAPVVPDSGPPPVTLPGTELRTLRSDRVEGVTYKLYVSLPNGYAESADRYPVVYLLDADYSFAIARNIVEHLSDRDDLPRLILVGIGYDGPLRYRENRTRDYTPSFTPTGGYGPEYQALSGGAPAFRDFIEAELIPFIEDDYRVSADRTLVGHSFGGLFGSWVAVTRPDLFARYLLVSPSLWYHDRMVFDVEEEYSRNHDDLNASIYAAVGSRERNSQRDMRADLHEFTDLLGSRRYPGLTLRVDVLEDETHNSVFPRALSNGLRTLF